MRWVVALIGIVAALALIAASMVMNFHFWAGQGESEFSGRILSGVSLAVDAFKAILPMVIAMAWAERNRVGLTIAAGFFCICLVFSFFSAVGFAASSRGAVAGGREALALRYAGAVKELGEVEVRLAALNNPRPQRVVEEALARSRQDRRWVLSKECSDITSEASRTYCKDVGDLKIELASAVEAERMRTRIATLKTETRNLAGQGARQDTDPQAGMLARLSGWGVERSQFSLVLFVALIVELGAAFGLFLATLPLQHKPVAKAKATPLKAKPTPAAPVQEEVAVPRIPRSQSREVAVQVRHENLAGNGGRKRLIRDASGGWQAQS